MCRRAHLDVGVYSGFRIHHIGNVVCACGHMPYGCWCSAKPSAGSAHESHACGMITVLAFLEVIWHFAKCVVYQVEECKLAPGARRGWRNRSLLKKRDVPRD